MFACRLALALGMLPSQVDDIPARDYELLQLYWEREPWGALRDNLHAAIIAQQVARPHLKKGAKVTLQDFMLRHPEEVEEERASLRKRATAAMFRALKSLAIAKRGVKNG